MLLASLCLAAFAASASEAAATIKPTPKPINPGCHSKGVSVHTFYGRTSDLERYLGDLSEKHVGGRLQVVVVESSNGAQVHVLEREQGRTYSISSWTGQTVGNLRAEWDATILKSRGNSCAGADLVADLNSRGMALTPRGNMQHVSASQSFMPMVSKEPGYMRVTLFDPCE